MNNPVEHPQPNAITSPAGPLPATHPVTGEPGGQKESHKVSAIYPNRVEAEAIRQRLIERGLAASDVTVLHEAPMPTAQENRDANDSDEVLKEVLVDGAIGTAVGTGVGVLGTAVLWASGVTLFVASPVVAPLAMLGWFASAGGIVGAAVGAEQSTEHGTQHTALRKQGTFSELVEDAIKAGSAVLVARTHDEIERDLASRIINDSLKGRDEIATESD